MSKPVWTSPETLALHGGSHRADPTTGSVAVPIHQTTSFQFQDTGHAARLFGLQELGNIYTRIMNPTQDALETRIAALEGGVAALAVASGQSATAFCVLNLAAAGDNIVSSTDLYGGTWNLFANTLKQMGIEVRFVDPTDPEAFARATDAAHPRLLRGDAAEPEAAGLPDRRGGRHRPQARRAADHGQHRGADPLPAARARRGGGDAFDHQVHRRPWHQHRRHRGRWRQFRLGGAAATASPTLNTPDPSYHGAVWTQAVKPLGPIAYILRMRALPAARPRRRDDAVQRLPPHPGAGDAAAAHGAPLRATPAASPASSRSSRA